MIPAEQSELPLLTVVPKGCLVSEVVEGASFTGAFLVEDVQVKLKKNKEEYLTLTFKDRTGSIKAKKWDGGEAPKRGSFVKVQCDVTSYQNVLELNVKQMRELTLNESVAVEDFVPIGPNDRFADMRELKLQVMLIEHSGLRALCQHVVDDPALHMDFRDAPAATGNHHAYVGGLVAHVLSMIGLARRVAGHYSALDVDLLVAACVFHDIGKIRELTWKTSLEYSREGRLVGHVVIGLEILDRLQASFFSGTKYETPEAYDEDCRTFDHLRHLIASHHGNLEWGAAKKPMSREAVAFHLIDMMDSRMAGFDGMDLKLDDEGFSGWIRQMEGPVWVENPPRL